MQISTSLFYDQTAARMAALTQQSNTLSTQISTNQRLQGAADDPIAYQRLQGLARSDADGTAYAANVTLAQSLLQQGDTTLSAITTQLQQAQGLATQAANGTLTDANRQTIATQIDGILSSITGLMNTRDARGQALFGGADGSAAVTSNADGSVTLADGSPSAIPIGDGQSVAASESAGAVLRFTGSAGATDVLTVLANLSAALKSGGDPTAAASGALGDLQKATDQVAGAQASLGARSARLDLVTAQMKSAATDRSSVESDLGETDVTTAISELQKTMTVLQATQASFTKLSSLSLFDYLK